MTVFGRSSELDLSKNVLGIIRAPKSKIFLWYVFQSNSLFVSRNFCLSANYSLKIEKFGKLFGYSKWTSNYKSARKVARNFKLVRIVYNVTSPTQIHQFERNFASIYLYKMILDMDNISLHSWFIGGQV